MRLAPGLFYALLLACSGPALAELGGAPMTVQADARLMYKSRRWWSTPADICAHSRGTPICRDDFRLASHWTTFVSRNMTMTRRPIQIISFFLRLTIFRAPRICLGWLVSLALLFVPPAGMAAGFTVDTVTAPMTGL